MTKETLNAQEIEHLRDHGTLPAAEVEAESVPNLEKAVTPTLEKAGDANINEEVIGEAKAPTVEDAQGG